MLKNKEDGLIYSKSNGRELEWECPECKNIVVHPANYICNRGWFNCPICSEGTSFPERFVYHTLKQLRIKFKHDYGTEWSGNRRYDFILEEYNTIIEVHGGQHYRECGGRFRTLEEEIENDKNKKELAILNGMVDYIVINGSSSTFSNMKEEMIKEMRLKFDLDSVDFSRLQRDIFKSRVVDTWDIWNNEKDVQIKEIGERLDLTRGTVSQYLRRGSENGKVRYNPQEESERYHFDKKAVAQLSLEGNLVKYWSGITEASEHYGCIIASIHQVCTGSAKTCVGYNWMFKEDYERHIEEDIPIPKRRVWMQPSKRLCQLTEDGKVVKIWDRPIEASEAIGCHGSSIRKATVTNKLSKGYRWMYENDYNKFINSGEEFQSYQGHFTDGKVIQLSLEGDFIKEWSSPKEASNSFGVKANIVTTACKVDNRTALGYRWQFSHSYFKSK